MSEAPLLLIRHAESTWNAKGRWQGHGDPPLSDRGRAQASALARELAYESIDVIISSDLCRAVETAAIVGETHDLRPELNPRLRELDIGKWEGLTRDEIESTSGDALRRFDAGNLDVRPGAGENLRELEQRAHSIVNELVGAHPGRRLAVVTHLGVIRALLGAFREIAHGDGKGPSSTDPESELDNASWQYLTPG